MRHEDEYKLLHFPDEIIEPDTKYTGRIIPTYQDNTNMCILDEKCFMSCLCVLTGGT